MRLVPGKHLVLMVRIVSLGLPSPFLKELSVPEQNLVVSCGPGSAKRWFSWRRFVGNRCTGFTFSVMHTWCPPVLMEYGSRAPERWAIRFLSETFLTSQHFYAGN